jgi:hypothetical protein
MTLGAINTVALSLPEAKLAEGQRCLTVWRNHLRSALRQAQGYGSI